MLSSGVEEARQSQQEASRQAEGKMALLHISSKMSLSHWVRSPLHWK